MDLKAWADNQNFIVLCYCFSFGPWAILFAFDFISLKWKTIRDTRTYGKIHLFFSTITLAVAVFYLIVQRAAGDYKEMMASCVAGIAALYHIARTISGLARLRAYSIWCIRAVHCLQKLNSIDIVPRNTLREHKDWKDQRLPKFARTHESLICSHTNCHNSSLPASSIIDGANSTMSGASMRAGRSSNSIEIASEYRESEGLQGSTTIHFGITGTSDEEVAELIDTRMLVNNQVIDNELFGSELPVRLCLPRCGILNGLLNVLRLRFDYWLCSGDIVRCTIRWSIAVLSNFGQHWVHCNKPKSFAQTYCNLYLPYHMVVPEKFHLVLRAYQNTLAADVFFYNGGVLDDVDISLRNVRSEIDLSRKRVESLRNMDTNQILYFLALMAQYGDTTDIPMEPAELMRASLPRRYQIEPFSPFPSSSNSSHRVSFGLDECFFAVPTNPASSSDQKLHALEENASNQMPPLQPASSRRPSLRTIPGIESEPNSFRRQVTLNSERSTNTSTANETTDETQNTEDSLREGNSSENEELFSSQGDSLDLPKFLYCTLSWQNWSID